MSRNTKTFGSFGLFQLTPEVTGKHKELTSIQKKRKILLNNEHIY
jgi:hypothetical protein